MSNETTDCVNQLEIIVPAIQRSGHHAVLLWILSNTTRKYCFLNNCKVSVSPFNLEFILQRKELRVKTNVEGFSIFSETSGKFTKKDMLLYNFENQFLSDIFSPEFLDYKKQWVGSSRNTLTLLVLRDPLNNLASFLKRNPGITWCEVDRFLQLWASYANEALGITDLCCNKYVIDFGMWNKSADYRKRIADDFNLVDNGVINQVTSWGGGSSFSGSSSALLGSRDELLKRWEAFSKDSMFLRCFRSDEFVAAAQQYYEQLPDNEYLYNSFLTIADRVRSDHYSRLFELEDLISEANSHDARLGAINDSHLFKEKLVESKIVDRFRARAAASAKNREEAIYWIQVAAKSATADINVAVDYSYINKRTNGGLDGAVSRKIITDETSIGRIYQATIYLYSQFVFQEALFASKILIARVYIRWSRQISAKLQILINKFTTVDF